ncbi:MAG: hypothetical protein A2Z72_08705 [Omnitrophica bacterium RBG_13_46_9]|nr:MAG: hypothetical protein A2Z72_08705 [Omnitrophica bacterium RBG_13_46_9]
MGEHMQRKRILIIDDEENLAYIIKVYLENTGLYEVGVETDPFEAVSDAISYRPDLILLDIMMPGKDGFQVLKALKGNNKTASIPVVMLSALQDDRSKMKAVERYCEGYVEKQAVHEKLQAKIEEILKRR